MKSLWAFELPLTTMTTPECGMPAGTAFVLCYRPNVTFVLSKIRPRVALSISQRLPDEKRKINVFISN